MTMSDDTYNGYGNNRSAGAMMNGNGKAHNGGDLARNDHRQQIQEPHKVLVTIRFLVSSLTLSMLLAVGVGRIARRSLLARQKRACHDDSNRLPTSNQPVTCRQLFVDLDSMDRDFLQSEQLLTNALLETIVESKLHQQQNKLSYYCHGQKLGGATCVATFHQSDVRGHVSLHTRPQMGVLTMDILLCRENDSDEGPLDLLENTARIFGQYKQQGIPEPQLPDGKHHSRRNVHWNIKRRGSLPFTEDYSDLQDEFETAGSALKQVIVSVQTQYQHITLLESLDLQEELVDLYFKSLETDGSYFAQNPTSFRPDRQVFLNGVIQSARDDDAGYHETLVHPAMFAHNGPERVAVIGGGEGATLREVLKHNTVQQAIMIEIDEIMIQVARDYLPEWNDCSNLVGSNVQSCFDEPRAKVYSEDALAWFIDRFHKNETSENAEPIDVIIMDALDPQDRAEFCDALYNHDVFVQSLYNALTPDGVLVMQLGEAPDNFDPPDIVTLHSNRAEVIALLEDVGFESLQIYHDEGQSGFDAPWTYLVAFKNFETKVNWYANEAEVELAIHERAMKTKNGEAPFLYFDGAVMVSYQMPHKAFESVFCRGDPQPQTCQTLLGFDPYIPNVPITEFEVKTSSAGEHAGRGLFAKVDIPENSYIAIETGVDDVFYPPTTYALIDEFSEHEEADALTIFDYYMHGYGFESEYMGDTEITVDSSYTTFVNHGCNGSFNTGSHSEPRFTENDVDPRVLPRELTEWDENHSLYNPSADRHVRGINSSGDVSLRKILAGEELFTSYLSMTTDPEEWANYVGELRAQCSGTGVGDVKAYENEHTR